MPAKSGWGIQKGIYNVLVNDTILSNLVTGIYDKVPNRTAYPYIRIGETTGVPFDTFGRDGGEHTETIHIWSNYKGNKEIWEIMSRIEEVLENGIVVEGYSVVTVKCELADVIELEDIRHGVMRFRCKVQEG